MIALPYTILYNIGHYDAIISYFALAKWNKNYGAITPYYLKIFFNLKRFNKKSFISIIGSNL